MITPEQYVGVVAERIQRSGGRLNSVQIGPAMAAVGLFTESVMRSTMNYAVIAAPVADVSAAALYDFTARATQHARANVAGTIGWNAASIVIVGLVGNHVHPDAAQAALSPSYNIRGSETRMVAVDMTAGYSYASVGDRLLGTSAQASTHARLTFCFPQPPEIYTQLQWQAQQQTPTPPPGWEPQVPSPPPP